MIRSLACILVGVVIGCLMTAIGFYLWVHHMYTVGVDATLSACVLAALAVSLICAVALVVSHKRAG